VSHTSNGSDDSDGSDGSDHSDGSNSSDVGHGGWADGGMGRGHVGEAGVCGRGEGSGCGMRWRYWGRNAGPRACVTVGAGAANEPHVQGGMAADSKAAFQKCLSQPLRRPTLPPLPPAANGRRASTATAAHGWASDTPPSGCQPPRRCHGGVHGGSGTASPTRPRHYPTEDRVRRDGASSRVPDAPPHRCDGRTPGAHTRGASSLPVKRGHVDSRHGRSDAASPKRPLALAREICPTDIYFESFPWRSTSDHHVAHQPQPRSRDFPGTSKSPGGPPVKGRILCKPDMDH